MMRKLEALALAGLLLAPRAAIAEPCPPRAALQGDPDAVARVTNELRRLGVAVAPATGSCPSAQAHVERDDRGAIVVALQRGRSSERRVMSDPAGAAVWIDAWTRDDLEVASWNVAPVLVRTTPGMTVPGDVAPTRAQSSGHRIELAGSYEHAWMSDDAEWQGASAMGCARFGHLCVGLRARAAFDPTSVAKSTVDTASDLSLLGVASSSFELGEALIAPELGLGAGRFHARYMDVCVPAPPVQCDPNEAGCLPQPVPCEPIPGPTGEVVKDVTAVSYTPRASFAIRLAAPLFEHVWLDGLAAISFAPFHIDEEPARGIQLGVGLRVGVP
ncbi:MAG: hypothetical protein AB7P03_18865 [Kofleriaceae bacterium]